MSVCTSRILRTDYLWEGLRGTSVALFFLRRARIGINNVESRSGVGERTGSWNWGVARCPKCRRLLETAAKAPREDETEVSYSRGSGVPAGVAPDLVAANRESSTGPRRTRLVFRRGRTRAGSRSPGLRDRRSFGPVSHLPSDSAERPHAWGLALVENPGHSE